MGRSSRVFQPGLLIALGFALLAAGCNSRGGTGPLKVQQIRLADLGSPELSDAPVSLFAAKNEWTDFSIQVSGLPPAGSKASYALKLRPLRIEGQEWSLEPNNYSVFQVLSVPVDLNRAAYVRHTGALVEQRPQPRVLMPAAILDAAVNVSAMRSPENPLLVWFDLHVPVTTKAGEYQGVIDLIETSAPDRPLATIPIKLTVYDFVTPDERHLLMVSRVTWDSLKRHHPVQFEAVTKNLLSRTDERYAPAVKVLDQLAALAQANRTEVVFPDLQPTVKWPAGRAPVFDWAEFDGLVQPWLSGQAFVDKSPLGYWPLPAVEYLDRFDRVSRGDYWSSVATHFDQKDWLTRAAMFMEPPAGMRPSDEPAVKRILAEAADTLRSHPRIRVTVPLQEDQIEVAGMENPRAVEAGHMARLQAAAPGLVFSAPSKPWAPNVPRPQKWLRTDLPGLMPYAGAGSAEADVRLWAWLAFLNESQLILWDSALPRTSQPNEPADPSEMVWFYPGSWFGVDQPLPTIQLKWLRRAQQDYDYLRLAEQRGETSVALVMARLIAKPVQILPGAYPDPAYAMMSGTTDPQAWERVRQLLAKTILLREPGQVASVSRRHELDLETLRWVEPQERPTLMARTSAWGWAIGEVGNWVELTLGVDLYNASDDPPRNNTLEWTKVPTGWRVRPQPVMVPSMPTYQVTRVKTSARFDLDSLRGPRTEPLEASFTNGFSKTRTPLTFALPVGASDKREGNIALDGSLADWNGADAIQNGPLVRMINRPALQKQLLQHVATPSEIYTGWSAEKLYIAFKVAGVSPLDARASRNFIDYQLRRAWGEDVCQVLVQPIYVDNSVGPITHLAFKPSGSQWAERKTIGTNGAATWVPFEGSGIHYAATLEGDTWRGEIAIPWGNLNQPGKGVPSLLRFNFLQHQTGTGQSASWAGPLDEDRDDAFMGLLHLRELPTPGIR